ncbi:MAG: glycosyltransferase [Canibacter sp.]
MDSIGEGRGGLTQAVFKRLRYLSKDRNLILATVAYQSDIREIFQRLITAGHLPDSTKLINFHEDLSDTPSVRSPRSWWKNNKQKSIFDEADWATSEEFDKSTLKRYFLKGVFLGTQKVDNASRRVIEAEFHDTERPWVRTHKEWYRRSSSSCVRRRDYFDEEGKTRYRIYFDSTGFPYAATWVTPTGYEYRTVMKEQQGGAPLKDMKRANSIWLEKKISEFKAHVVFADEPRTNFAFQQPKDGVFRIASLHADHRLPGPSGIGLKHFVSDYVGLAPNIDKFLFFTEMQAKVFSEDTGVSPDQITVIPHSAPDRVEQETAKPTCDEVHIKNSLNLVSLGRLSSEKRIDHVIQAVHMVHNEGIDVTLDIWGKGDEEAELKKLVTRLKMDETIRFRGRTDDAVGIFSMYDSSIMASQAEGFGLVILESFSAGTPVIGYDALYGPKELIAHRTNGLVAESGNILELANSIRALTDRNLLNSLSKGARGTAKKYSSHNWRSAFDSLLDSFSIKK